MPFFFLAFASNLLVLLTGKIVLHDKSPLASSVLVSSIALIGVLLGMCPCTWKQVAAGGCTVSYSPCEMLPSIVS